jgi:hypothetical protein
MPVTARSGHARHGEITEANPIIPIKNERNMVTKYTKKGTAYGEPPYTEAEEAEFYRRFGNNIVSVAKATPEQRREAAAKQEPEPAKK